MGEIKRKRKLYSRPKKPFDKRRIDEENVQVKKYGLKNKREIWKAQAKVSTLRRRAKSLIGRSPEVQKVFFDKLQLMGFNVQGIADILGLTTDNFLDRRLQSILVKKKLVRTPKEARQLIVHKHVLINGDIVNIPSFHVTRDLESKISLKVKRVKPEVIEEVKEEIIAEVPANG